MASTVKTSSSWTAPAAAGGRDARRPLVARTVVAAGFALTAASFLAVRQAQALPAFAGSMRPVSLSLVFLLGIALGVLSLAPLLGSRRRRDAESRRELERLAQVARTDDLTGLKNYRGFHEDLTEEIAHRNRTGQCFTLLMIDLDGLKRVNDTEGHQAGDRRIRAAADCLRSTLEGVEHAYRIGGDEYTVILRGARAWAALSLAQELQSEAARCGVSLTVGIAESLETESRDTIIRRADLALYEAKRTRSRTAVYSPTLELQRETDDEVDVDEHHHKILAGALARAVDAKDAGTRNHCETVAELCVLIGTSLGLSPERLGRLRLAGLLHDVGKIGIADAILQKPDVLGQEEREIMRTHPWIGYTIVSAAELEDEAEWVLHHHERFDGTGYPHGLEGSAIPLESRIILVADSFEAMTGSRPYRDPSPQLDALSELAAHAGTQFDPRCVAALQEALQVSSLPVTCPDDELAARRRRREEVVPWSPRPPVTALIPVPSHAGS